MTAFLRIGAVVFVSLLTACGQGGVDATVTVPTETTVSAPVTSSEIELTAGRDGQEDVYHLDGFEIVTRLRGDQLPDNASRIRLTTLVVDRAPEPPVACIGVNDSIEPPRCPDGLELIGTAPLELAESRWGVVTIEALLAADKRSAEVLSAGPAENSWTYRPALPAGCDATATSSAHRSTMVEYVGGLPANAGSLFRASSDTWVLQVLDDPEPHRLALKSLGVTTPCAIKVAHSMSSLLATQRAVLGIPGLDVDLS
ncbi:MAG: hypothetical protein GXP35_10385, partial [Actinobacteria bacterium]|nr:hypothetical protein [Actinomycetota bacterium]